MPAMPLWIAFCGIQKSVYKVLFCSRERMQRYEALMFFVSRKLQKENCVLEADQKLCLQLMHKCFSLLKPGDLHDSQAAIFVKKRSAMAYHVFVMTGLH